MCEWLNSIFIRHILHQLLVLRAVSITFGFFHVVWCWIVLSISNILLCCVRECSHYPVFHLVHAHGYMSCGLSHLSSWLCVWCGSRYVRAFYHRPFELIKLFSMSEREVKRFTTLLSSAWCRVAAAVELPISLILPLGTAMTFRNRSGILSRSYSFLSAVVSFVLSCPTLRLQQLGKLVWRVCVVGILSRDVFEQDLNSSIGSDCSVNDPCLIRNPFSKPDTITFLRQLAGCALISAMIYRYGLNGSSVNADHSNRRFRGVSTLV